MNALLAGCVVFEFNSPLQVEVSCSYREWVNGSPYCIRPDRRRCAKQESEHETSEGWRDYRDKNRVPHSLGGLKAEGGQPIDLIKSCDRRAAIGAPTGVSSAPMSDDDSPHFPLRASGSKGHRADHESAKAEGLDCEL